MPTPSWLSSWGRWTWSYATGGTVSGSSESTRRCVALIQTVPLRLKAVRTTLSITAAGFLTVLPSYFTHRDLFPSLMKYIQDCEVNTRVLPAFYLLGLLVNYNKFEFQNPYRLRLDDFVNDAIIHKIIVSFGETCVKLRDAYIAVQDDMPEGWSLGSTLNYFSLGLLAPASTSRPVTPTPNAEESKSLFATLYVELAQYETCSLTAFPALGQRSACSCRLTISPMQTRSSALLSFLPSQRARVTLPP